MSTQTMRAAMYYGKRDIRVEDVPIPEPGPGECLVEPEWVGICGTDLHEYVAGPFLMAEDSVLTAPAGKQTGETRGINLGHEFGGRLRSVSKGSNLKVGQAVMVDPHLYCSNCPACQSGDNHICQKLTCHGCSSHLGGGLSELVAVNEAHCLVLPDSISLEYAALIEPLAACYHAVKTAGVDLNGLDVLVVGGGPVGSGIIAVLRTQNLGKLLLSEPISKRREQNRETVDRAIDPRTEKVEDVCRELTGGKGVDVVFDCAGVQPALETGFDALKHGGIFVNVAVWEKPVSSVSKGHCRRSRTNKPTRDKIPFMAFFFKEINVRSTCCYTAQDFKETIDLLGSGKLKGCEKMVSSRISMEDTVAKGFEELVNNKDDHIKILISPKLKASS